MIEYSPKQKELNLMISQELDHHHIQNEYGQLLLDKDQNSKNKYKWLSNIQTVAWVELFVAVITSIIGVISDLRFLFGIGLFLILIFGIYLLIRYSHREIIAKWLSEEQRKELTSTLESHSKYLTLLRKWFIQVGANKKTDSNKLNEIEAQLNIKYNEGHDNYNKLSTLFGTLDESLHAKAREKTEAKLKLLLPYFIIDNV